MERKKSISKEEINTLPLMEYPGIITVVEDKSEAASIIQQLSNEKVLGFDTETRPSFHKGQVYQASLLQLATEDHAYLFRLRRTGLIPEMVALFSNEKIIKAGVAIKDDVIALQKLSPFEAAGFVDLSKEVERRGYKNFSLRALTAIFLGKRLSKAAKLTNWDQKNLTEAQVNYAANDALVGLKIYQELFGTG